MGHDIFAPSGAKFWGNCAGYIDAVKEVGEQPATAETIAGDAAHLVCSESIRTGQAPDQYLGQKTPDGSTIVTDEMVDAAIIYVDHCRRQRERAGQYAQELVEFPVRVPQVHPTDCGGTLDHGLVAFDGRVLKIWIDDFKFGFLPVRATGNWQLLLYVLGLVNFMGLADTLDDRNIVVYQSIVQPRNYHGNGPVDYVEYQLSDMRADVNQLARQAQRYDRSLSAGPWCRDCPAASQCSAAREVAVELFSRREVPYDLDVMPPEAMGLFLSQLEDGVVFLTKLRDAVHDHVTEMAKTGKPTGWTLSSVLGRRKWSHPDQAIIDTFEGLGVDADAGKAKTPTQVINAAPKGQREQVKAMVGALSRAESGLKLTKSSEGTLARVFGKLEK